MHSTFRLLVTASVVVVAACASTTLDSSWKDPQYRGGPVSKILVVGISSQAGVRRAFEDTFAQALTQRGVQAVPSYTLIAQDGQIAEETLQKAVEQAGANGVLITRMAGRKTDLSVTPAPMAPPIYGMRRNYYGYYAGAWNGAYEPATVQQYDYVVTETTLYRADAPEPVWSGTARTLEPNDVRKATEDFAKVMIDALKKESLI